MTYVIVAKYRVQSGEERFVRDALLRMAQYSRTEPGCLAYYAHTDVDDVRAFLLYEQYESEAAFEQHMRQPYFVELIRQGVIPRLEHRERGSYEILEDGK